VYVDVDAGISGMESVTLDPVVVVSCVWRRRTGPDSSLKEGDRPCLVDA